MTRSDGFHTYPIHRFPLSKLALFGWVIGLIAILIFILPVINHPNVDWPNYWVIRPLVITPLAGAAGGVWYFIMDYLRYQGGWKTVVAYALSLLGFIIAIWIGIVLGLVGTMWH